MMFRISDKDYVIQLYCQMGTGHLYNVLLSYT